MDSYNIRICSLFIMDFFEFRNFFIKYLRKIILIGFHSHIRKLLYKGTLFLCLEKKGLSILSI
jgi:hypothetical protein